MQKDLETLLSSAGEHVDRVFYNLESLCICFPARLSGSETLEKSLDFLFEYGRRSFDQERISSAEEVVHGVPRWIRGNWQEEYCNILIDPSPSAFPQPFPLTRTIRVLANGTSIGSAGISGNIHILKSWDQINVDGAAGLLKGKVALFDYVHYTSYGDHAIFRAKGAHAASKHGAVAVLIRSLAPDDTLSGPHTGVQWEFEESELSIPAGCIAVEDAELLRRLAQRGHGLRASLFLPCHTLPASTSRNLIFEMKGTECPEEIVIVGGHTDCWDCQCNSCQGAHDDGQGVIIALEILRILHDLGWKPRRTIRAVLFVDEEVRQSGANAYAKAHAHEASNIVAAIETDLGVGPVCGFGFSGSSVARQALRELLKPISVALDKEVSAVDDRWSGGGVDISPLIDQHGVPGLLLRHEDSWWHNDYFHMHHSTGDTIDHVNKDMLLLNFQVLLCTVWLLANCDEKLHELNRIKD